MKTKTRKIKIIEIILIFSIIFLISLLSFQLGKFSVKYENNKLSKEENQKNNLPKIIKKKVKTVGVIVSKKGKTYHLPWCPGATSMLQKNKIYFNSIAEAKAAGYLPAKNCEGL